MMYKAYKQMKLLKEAPKRIIKPHWTYFILKTAKNILSSSLSPHCSCPSLLSIFHPEPSSQISVFDECCEIEKV